MKSIYPRNMIRLLRRAAEAGDPGAELVTDLARRYLAAIETDPPDRHAIARLESELGTQKLDTRFHSDIVRMVRNEHYYLNVLPYLPTTIAFDLAVPEGAVCTMPSGPARGEGRRVCQTSGPGAYGHVVLSVEPAPLEEHVQLHWQVADDVIPKVLMPGIFDGLREVVDNPREDGSWVVYQSISATGGSFHVIDSSERAYKLAAKLAFDEAISKIGLTSV